MCSSRQVLDPLNVLFNPKTNKFADPLGLTRTAVGDPTGRMRKQYAAVEKEKTAELHRTPSAVPYRTLLANGSEALVGAPAPKQAQWKWPKSLLGGGG